MKEKGKKTFRLCVISLPPLRAYSELWMLTADGISEAIESPLELSCWTDGCCLQVEEALSKCERVRRSSCSYSPHWYVFNGRSISDGAEESEPTE